MKTVICAAGTLAFGALLGAVLFGGAAADGSREQRISSAELWAVPSEAAVDSASSARVALAHHLAPEDAPPKRLAEADPAPTATEEAVRAVIERRLQDATPEERQIWFEELKGLPPAIVEDLLALRRQIGSAQPKASGGLAAHDDPLARHRDARVAPTFTTRPEWSEAAHALLQARDVHLHNLANAYSPGYKRLVPEFAPLAAPGDLADSRHSARWGSCWEGTRLDVRAGEITTTGRMLDVAIHGPGWFAVRTGEHVRYTRNGKLTLDNEGRLCVSTAVGALPLEPVVRVPEANRRVSIREDGAVFAARGDADALVKCGQIQLAVIREATSLSYQADGLLQAQVAGALVAPGQSDVGTLVPLSLERSNVDADAEWSEIERIDRWLGAMRR